MSKIALRVIWDESVVAGVGDLANSWVMTGMAIVVIEMKKTNRSTLRLNSASEGEGMVEFEVEEEV